VVKTFDRGQNIFDHGQNIFDRSQNLFLTVPDLTIDLDLTLTCPALMFVVFVLGPNHLTAVKWFGPRSKIF